MELMENYKISPTVTDEMLRNEGFRHGVFRCYVYKHLIRMIVFVDTQEKWWSYQICNTDTDTLYIPYYDRRYGKSEIVIRIDSTVKQILDEMVVKNILIKYESAED